MFYKIFDELSMLLTVKAVICLTILPLEVFKKIQSLDIISSNIIVLAITIIISTILVMSITAIVVEKMINRKY